MRYLLIHVLSICLLLVEGADRPTADRPSAQEPEDDIVAASQLMESLNREIEEASDKPESRSSLAPMYTSRGWLLLGQGHLQKAKADFDAALARKPLHFRARLGRAEYFRRTGQLALAEAEMRQVVGQQGVPRRAQPFHSASAAPLAAGPFSPTAAWVVLATAWAVATIANVFAGWRQKVEASGTMARLLWAAVCLGLMQILPLAVWAFFVTMGQTWDIQLPLAAGLALLCLLLTIKYLKPPVRLLGTKEKLPYVTDELFLARVAELAAKMNVPMPLIRLWPSIAASQNALAFTGTIQAPQLVVTDGILHRLASAERDAIVAHELAHITNGSLWVLAAVLPVSCAAATAASAFVAQSVVWPFGVAFYVGLRRLVSRPYEIDCDRRAARAIGFRETTTALAKIHAVHPLRNAGLLSLLVYATATHPSRDIRLAALLDAAPDSDRPTIELSESRILWQRRLTIAALVVWFATVSITMTTAVLEPEIELLPLPLWIVGLLPLALILLAQWKQFAIVRRRMGTRRRWIVAMIITSLFGVSLYLSLSQQESRNRIPPSFVMQLRLVAPLLILGSLIGVVVWLQRTQRRRKLRHAMAVAFQLHDFRRALELGKQSPRVVARDHVLRYNFALALALCGDRPAAIAMLQGLWQDKPHFPLTAFALAELLLDASEPERALDVAKAVVQRLPRDAGTHALEARIRRHLGQLDEAQAACDRVLALEPEDGTGHGIAAAIALDRGDLAGAQGSIAQALTASPGEAHLLMIHAEIALQTQPLEAARIKVEHALATVRANPLAFLQSDISRLEQKLSTGQAEASSSAQGLTGDPGTPNASYRI